MAANSSAATEIGNAADDVADRCARQSVGVVAGPYRFAGSEVVLRAEQQQAVARVAESFGGFAPFLLFGITGSGKTEVYLHAIAALLATRPRAQALLIVPEINLTPQLERQVRQRFPGELVVPLHSGLAAGARDSAWWAAHTGQARVIVGTRLAVFASAPQLGLIIVDEEHDPSLKAGKGVKYSARDLAVKRAQLLGVPVVLGSATPALETWLQSQKARYTLLPLVERAGAAELARRAQAQEPPAALDPASGEQDRSTVDIARSPSRPGPDGSAASVSGGPAPDRGQKASRRGLARIITIDLRQDKAESGLSQPLREALGRALAAGQQALVFINRRGYAPVLCCDACGWLSDCPHCSVHAAFHKREARLRCHHCGWQQRVPVACPTCGNQDLQPVGQGTQRVEETLRELLPQARLARLDRDNTRRKGSADATLDAVHAGQVDILVGTQMIVKGHDFQRVSLVCVLNADAQLLSTDFRAPERLYSMLTQVAGRAGRAGQAADVLIQTRYPHHPLFESLARHDFGAFAAEQLEERLHARLPPYTHAALLTATAREHADGMDFLARAQALAQELARQPALAGVRIYDPVPMPVERLADEHRGQLLVEAGQRALLHRLLRDWLAAIRAEVTAHKLKARWYLEVDPAQI